MSINSVLSRNATRLITASLLLLGQAWPAEAAVIVRVTGTDAPETTIEGNAPIEADTPDLKGSVAKITGNSLSLEVKEGGSTNTVMSGIILKSELSKTEFKGYVAFQEGSKLVKIDDPEVEEMIEIEGGQVVSGHITEIDGDKVKIGDKEVPMSKISRLCSPRIYEFSCPLVASKDSSSTNFEANAAQLKLTRTTSPEKDKKKAGKGQKRCCFFPPIVAPIQSKGGRHIHVIIPF